MDFNFPAIVGLVSALWGGLPVDIDATPKGLLASVYRAHDDTQMVLSPDDIYSSRLQALLDQYFVETSLGLTAAADKGPPVELIAFDPLSLGTGPQNVVISDPIVHDHLATATVSFDNSGGPVQLSVFLVEQQDGWRVDDVASFDKSGRPWLLSVLLRYDPYAYD